MLLPCRSEKVLTCIFMFCMSEIARIYMIMHIGIYMQMIAVAKTTAVLVLTHSELSCRVPSTYLPLERWASYLST